MENEQGKEVTILQDLGLCHSKLELFDQFLRLFLKENVITKVSKHWIRLIEAILTQFSLQVFTNRSD